MLPLIPPVGKENPGWKKPATPSTVGGFAEAPTLTWPHEDFRRLWGAHPPGIWLWGRREESLQQPAQRSWLSSHLWSQVANPTSSFVHLQNQVRGEHWPGNLATGCRSAWFRSSERFCCPRARPAQSQVRNGITALPTIESVSCPRLTRRAGDNTCNWCYPAVLELRGGLAKPIVCRAKPWPCSVREPGMWLSLS